MNAPLPPALAPYADGIAKTREPLTTARHLPGALYASPDVAALEKERIFLRAWLCVGRTEEIPNIGDYVTCQVADEPFVLSRDDSGEVVAFMNMCLHRGVAVVQGKGNAKDFSCPYHAWLYDRGGNLIASPRMNSTTADLKNCRLKRLRSTVWRDWIFVTFDPDAMSFEDFIAPYEKELWWFRTDQCRMVDKMVIDVDCNWKLLIENLVDVYHVPVLHKGTFGGFVKKSRGDEFDVKLLPWGGWAYDQKARPHSKTGEQKFPTLPWLEGMGDDTSSRAGLYPNINMSMRYDSLRMWQVWPLSLTRTRLHVYLLFANSAPAQPGFEENLAEYKAFITQLVGEDTTMVISLQHAMKSPFYEPGPMSNLEAAVHHLMKQYLDALCEPAQAGRAQRQALPRVALHR
jgi:choline monooxygenase